MLYEVRVGKFKNGKVAGKDEITVTSTFYQFFIVVDWIWRLCNMTSESDVVPEDWRSVVMVPLYKGKGERNEYKIIKALAC